MEWGLRESNVEESPIYRTIYIIHVQLLLAHTEDDLGEGEEKKAELRKGRKHDNSAMIYM